MPAYHRAMDNEFLQRLRAAIAALETIGADWSLFDSLPVEDRERLHKAVATIHNPDRTARRKRQKDAKKSRQS